MRFSNLADRLPAKRNRLYAEYEKAASSGKPIVDLISTNLAEQGWVFPEERLQALLADAARQAQIYRPDPLGLRSAREAIANHYRLAGIRASADQVLITPGTSLSYFYCFKLLANPGDEILCPTPSYPLFESIAELGGLHILVNNAGISLRRLFSRTGTRSNSWEVSHEDWDRVLSVNLSGPFYMAKAVLGHMLEQGWGRIVGVTTSVDTMYRAGGSPYGPSKAGHEALIATMAQELEGTGVTANVLVPGGATDTNIIPEETDYDRSVLIRPEVMQAPIVWLTSEASHKINGRRFIAYYWDESLPLEERLEKSGAPAAWPQLGKQGIFPNR
jgi:NAD(P)-dependent dehydrogenase (short-subunit alcohol dehydrogenase family)